MQADLASNPDPDPVKTLTLLPIPIPDPVSKFGQMSNADNNFSSEDFLLWARKGNYSERKRIIRFQR